MSQTMLHEKNVHGNSSLVDYALGGLRRCWMPEHGRWSHIYHLDGRSKPNESVPPSDVFYSLNVLLGLSRVSNVPEDVEIASIFERNALLLMQLPVAKYAFGMALWAAAELHLQLPDKLANHIEGLLSNRSEWATFRAQDLGMLLSGVVAQAKAGETRWRPFADDLFAFLRQRFHRSSDLFSDASSGFRRRFATFATQTYLTLACYHYGELTGDLGAIRLAKRCTEKLIAQQGERGEWPWYFDAKTGRVLDFYEVYSVHQYGMAPAFLECAERYDVRGAQEAAIKGFKWVLGQNQLNKMMLVPDRQLSIRSQVRQGELQTNKLRLLRAFRNAYLSREAALAPARDLVLRLECRSYELGWVLWSFGQRRDLPQLTMDAAFSPATDGHRQETS